MGNTQEIEVLSAKVAELEAENRDLQAALTPGTPKGKARLRWVAAFILVLVGAILAPVAVLGGWVRAELVNTDQFVETFAPLASEPEVQAFIAGEVSVAIHQTLDVEGMIDNVFDGIAESNLPPKAVAALPLLKGPAANGVKSLIDSGVVTVVESPQFSSVWQTVLRETHSRAIAVIQGDTNAGLQLSKDGTLSLDLGATIAAVKDGLVAQGIGFADLIPEIDRQIPLVTSDSFATVRTAYQLAVGIGLWLPWVSGALLIAGVLVARNRLRALTWVGVSVAASLLLCLAGVTVGKWFFISEVSPSIMPESTAEILFAQLTGLASSTLVSLTVLFAAIAIGAWLSGSSKLAASIRGAGESVFAGIRNSADSHGLSTGKFGRLIDRWHVAIVAVAVLVSVLLVFLIRPITVGGVIATVFCLLGLLLIVELLRRPEPELPATRVVSQPRET